MFEESFAGLTHRAGSSPLLLSTVPVHRKPFIVLRRGDFYIASAHLTTLGLYEAFLSGIFMVFSTVHFNEALSLMSPIIDYASP